MAYTYNPLLDEKLDKYRSDAELNDIYLRLDCSNDPLTNTLDGNNFDFNGHGGLGADGADTATIVLDIDETFQFVDSTRYGCFTEMDLETTGALGSATHLLAWDAQARWVGSDDGSVHASVQGIKGEAVTWDCLGDCNQLVAVYGKANNLGQTDVTEAIGGLFSVSNDDGSFGELGDITDAYSILARSYTDKDTGVITNRYGLYIEDTTGGGLLTNQYGLYIPTLTGATNNYAAYIDGIIIPDVYDAVTGPTGFVDKTATLSFVNATRVFTITGDHDIYINGVKTTKTTDDITLGDTTGTHWVYYDAAGVISETTGDPDFSLPTIATIYYNTTAGFDKGLLGEERHGIKMDVDTHALLHYSVGTRYESGLTGTFGNTTFDTTSGVIADEDIPHSLGAATTCDVVYKDGAADFVWIENQTKYYYEDGGSDINYNNGNALAAATANYYVAYWIFATNSTTRPIISLMGQRQDKKLNDARANNKYESLTLGTLPFEEMKLLYRVILKNDATPYEETQDLRAVSNLPAGTYIATAHGVLSGLDADDHPQYVLNDNEPDHVGLGIAINAARTLTVYEILTHQVGGKYGIVSDMWHTPAGALSGTATTTGFMSQAQWYESIVDGAGANKAYVRGVEGNAITTQVGSAGNLYELIGTMGKARHRSEADVTIAIGVKGEVFNDNASTNDGSITNAYSFLASADATKTTGLIGTRYGLYVEDMATAAHTTNQYGIYCPALTGATGDNLFIKNISAASDFGSGDIDTTGTLTTTTLNIGDTELSGSGAELTIKPTTVNTDQLIIIDSTNTFPATETILRIKQSAGNLGSCSIEFADPASINGKIEYSHDTDSMIITTNGTEKVYIDANGKVGIGTTTPNASLEISKDDGAYLRLGDPDTSALAGDFAGCIEFYKADTSTGGAGVVNRIYSRAQDNGGEYELYFETGSVTARAVAMIISENQELGIGTLNPVAKLDVNGTIIARDKLLFTQTDGNEYIDSLAEGYMDYGATTGHRFGGPGVAISGDLTAGGTIVAEDSLIVGAGTKHDGYVILPSAEVQTTDATVTTIDSITLLNENTYHAEVMIAGVKSDGSQRASYHLAATVYRTSAGNATIQGTVSTLHTSESDATWNATFTVSGNDLRVSVTGKDATTVEWGCTLKYINMSN